MCKYAEQALAQSHHVTDDLAATADATAMCGSAGHILADAACAPGLLVSSEASLKASSTDGYGASAKTSADGGAMHISY